MVTEGPAASRQPNRTRSFRPKECTPLPEQSQNQSSTALVHEGWSHLKHQRPLAAWGSWQRALRADPDSVPAAQALAALEIASDLPLAARTTYRFRQPPGPARRALWDETMRGHNVEDLNAMVDLFGRLAVDDPTDAAAWYNRALCLAWLGDNLEAVSSLDHVVKLTAVTAFDQAVGAWTLAEVLRHGAGAEALADDLRCVVTLGWAPAETAWLLSEFAEIERVEIPPVPNGMEILTADLEIFEWLNRKGPGRADGRLTGPSLPCAFATVFADRHHLRLSSPRPETLMNVEESLLPRLSKGTESIRREASPLPLAFLDADVWTFRVPPAIDADRSAELRREAVENYYENEWIHRRRQGLDHRSPLEAAQAAKRGDLTARAKLAAVVLLREQLADRRSARAMYHGYPFDRLRYRLGLEPVDPEAVDQADLSCAPPDVLDRLDPEALEAARLVAAVESAVGLRDDPRTARFAAQLLRRQPEALVSSDLGLSGAVAPLVRQAMLRHDHEDALEWIERARPLAAGEAAAKLDTWKAEILARYREPEAALAVYRSLITADDRGAELALDAALTMLDNGHRDEAESLLQTARRLARRTGKWSILRRARHLLRSLT
jgi:tetratricopeptide (TPR) repeat protein